MDFGFGVGYSELFVLAIIAVVVIGPKDLPKVLRTFGQFMNKARAISREFQGHVFIGSVFDYCHFLPFNLIRPYLAKENAVPADIRFMAVLLDAFRNE